MQPFKSIKRFPKIKNTLSSVFQLLNICCMGIIFYGFNDVIQAFEVPLAARLKVSIEKMQLQYSLAALINFFTAPIAGIMCNRLGLGFSATIFAVFCCIGVYTTYFGVATDDYRLFTTGRVIYAIWAEGSFCAAILAILRTFEGKNSTAALSIAFSLWRVVQAGSNFGFPEIMIRSRSMNTAFFAVSVISTLQVAGSLYYYLVMEKKQAKKKKIKEKSILS